MSEVSYTSASSHIIGQKIRSSTDIIVERCYDPTLYLPLAYTLPYLSAGSPIGKLRRCQRLGPRVICACLVVVRQAKMRKLEVLRTSANGSAAERFFVWPKSPLLPCFRGRTKKNTALSWIFDTREVQVQFPKRLFLQHVFGDNTAHSGIFDMGQVRFSESFLWRHLFLEASISRQHCVQRLLRDTRRVEKLVAKHTHTPAHTHTHTHTQAPRHSTPSPNTLNRPASSWWLARGHAGE